MATYVMLIKEYEDNEIVIYKFGPEEEKLGRIKLEKNTGNFEELDSVPNIQRDPNFYLFRAASKLQKILRENNGEFPERTSFAS